VVLCVDVWVKDFVLGRSERVKVDGQISRSGRVSTILLQGSL
jgi:hypothetical protein